MNEPPLEHGKIEIPSRTSNFKVLCLPDIHFPYHDSQAIKLALKVSRVISPNLIIQMGDLLDSYSLSTKYQVDPSQRASRFKEELPPAREFLSTLRNQNPQAKIKLLQGNHEERLRKLLISNAPALLDLPELEIPSLLQLSKFRIDPVLYKDLWLTPDFVLTHGTKISQDASISGKKELLARLVSGASGHTHRLGSYRFRASNQLLEWSEFGHLASNPLSYMETPGNWQQGVGFLEVSGNHVFTQLLPFTLDYRCRIGGKTYAA